MVGPALKSATDSALASEQRASESAAHRMAWLAFLLSLLVYVALTPWVYKRWTPTGDEPHYLLATHSLLVDGDLDLRNNYELEHFARFYPFTQLDPHVVEISSGIWYPWHEAGLSLLLLPAYALAERAGVLYFLNLVAAMVAANAWLLAFELSGNQKAAWLAWGATAFTLPFLAYAFSVYPEMVAALLIVWTVRQLIRPERLSIWRSAALGLCLVTLPWLVVRFLPIASALFLILAIYGLRRQGPGRPQWLAFGLGSGGMLLAIILLNVKFYGAPLPPRIPSGSGTPDPGWLWNPWHHFDSFFGWLFDQRMGLFVYTPIFALAPLGWLLLWKQSRTGATLPAAAPIVGGTLLVQLASLGLTRFLVRGGIPPRYLVSAVPLAGALLAPVWAQVRSKFIVTIALALLAVSLCNAGLVVAAPERALFAHYDESKVLRIYSRFLRTDLNQLYPLFMPDMWYKDSGFDDVVEGEVLPRPLAFRQFAPLLVPIGVLVKDDQAAGGLATYMPEGTAGTCFEGPRLSLPAGKYSMTYRLRAERASAPEAILARVQVRTDGATLADRLLNGEELSPPGSYREIAIHFQLATRTEVTFALDSTGISALVADYAVLHPHDAWRARILALLWAGGVLLLTVCGYRRRAEWAGSKEIPSPAASTSRKQKALFGGAVAFLVCLILALVVKHGIALFGPRIFEGEAMPRQVGTVMAERKASGEKAVYGPAQSAGLLAYGPYEQLCGDAYRACFRLKREGVASDGPAAVLDVASNLGELVLARRELSTAEISQGVYQDVCLDFANVGCRQLEFRVYATGAAALWYDCVRLVPIR